MHVGVGLLLLLAYGSRHGYRTHRNTRVPSWRRIYPPFAHGVRELNGMTTRQARAAQVSDLRMARGRIRETARGWDGRRRWSGRFLPVRLVGFGRADERWSECAVCSLASRNGMNGRGLGAPAAPVFSRRGDMFGVRGSSSRATQLHHARLQRSKANPGSRLRVSEFRQWHGCRCCLIHHPSCLSAALLRHSHGDSGALPNQI